MPQSSWRGLKVVTRTRNGYLSRFSEALCHEIRFAGSNWLGILALLCKAFPSSTTPVNSLAGSQIGHEPVQFCETLSGS
jgi:hypothetical protein